MDLVHYSLGVLCRSLRARSRAGQRHLANRLNSFKRTLHSTIPSNHCFPPLLSAIPPPPPPAFSHTALCQRELLLTGSVAEHKLADHAVALVLLLLVVDHQLRSFQLRPRVRPVPRAFVLVLGGQWATKQIETMIFMAGFRITGTRQLAVTSG